MLMFRQTLWYALENKTQESYFEYVKNMTSETKQKSTLKTTIT